MDNIKNLYKSLIKYGTFYIGLVLLFILIFHSAEIVVGNDIHGIGNTKNISIIFENLQYHMNLFHILFIGFVVFSLCFFIFVFLKHIRMLTLCMDRQTFFDKILNSLSIPIFYKNIDGTYEYCNNAFYKNLNKKPEEIIGYHVRDIYKNIASKKTIDAFVTSDIRLVRNLEPEAEKATLSIGNMEKTYLIYKDILKDSNGDVVGILGMACENNCLESFVCLPDVSNAKEPKEPKRIRK